MLFDTQALIAQQSALATGTALTLGVSLTSAAIALVAGLVVAMGRKSGRVWLERACDGYIQCFRNTPLLIQLYFFYKALPVVGISLDPILCGILALSLQATAYMAEIFRAGFEAVPQGQVDSGLSLGFSRSQVLLTIQLPQALSLVVPALSNQIIGLIKNSSLLAFITVADLFFVIYEQSVTYFRYLEFFSVGLLLYMAMTLGVSWILRFLEPIIQRRLMGGAQPLLNPVPITPGLGRFQG